MKTVTENTTKNFEPVTIEGTDVTIEFSESVRDGVKRITGTPKKNGADMGLVTYNANEHSLTLSMKPLEGKNLLNLDSILTTIANCINEILDGENWKLKKEEKVQS